jgi:hypothetical protein
MNIYRNNTTSIPMKSDDVVVNLDVNDIGGRKSHLPPQHIAPTLPISHIPNRGPAPGMK